MAPIDNEVECCARVARNFDSGAEIEQAFRFPLGFGQTNAGGRFRKGHANAGACARCPIYRHCALNRNGL